MKQLIIALMLVSTAFSLTSKKCVVAFPPNSSGVVVKENVVLTFGSGVELNKDVNHCYAIIKQSVGEDIVIKLQSFYGVGTTFEASEVNKVVQSTGGVSGNGADGEMYTIKRFDSKFDF